MQLTINLDDHIIIDRYGEEIKLKDAIIVHNLVITKQELKDGTCTRCRDYENRNNRIIWNGDTYCNVCAATRCKKCGKPGTSYCESCMEKDKIIKCPACGETHSAHKTCMCVNVKNYLYKPKPFFRYANHEKRSIPTFGMEIELDGIESMLNRDALNDFAMDLQERSNGMMYAKEDSSIIGFEMVFHPMSLRFIQTDKTLRDLLRIAFEANPRQTSAGFHVHVGKNHFSHTGIFRLLKAIKEHKTQVALFDLSNRSMEDFQNWAAMPDYLNENEIKRVAKKARESNKHTAIAFLKETVEFRLFNGVKSFKEVLRNVKAVNSILQWTKYKRKISLHEWLKKDGLI